MGHKMAPLQKHLVDGPEDEDDFDEEYFLRTYRPLSNLPTPPPSHRDSVGSLSPRSLQEDELLDSALLGPAVHLVNLIPPTASLGTPSVPTVHEILARANLPPETIALAVCVLDSLNSRFSHNWRLSCPLAAGLEEAAQDRQAHIDDIPPEIIILTALVIAAKFVEDSQERMQYYASHWGNDVWTCEQINVTERCIMENLGYRILPLWDRELIRDALADMERAGKEAYVEMHQRFQDGGLAGTGQKPRLMPPTPLETPRADEMDGPGCSSTIAAIGAQAPSTPFAIQLPHHAEHDMTGGPPTPPPEEMVTVG